jgi:hypothetical protein
MLSSTPGFVDISLRLMLFPVAKWACIHFDSFEKGILKERISYAFHFQIEIPLFINTFHLPGIQRF